MLAGSVREACSCRRVSRRDSLGRILRPPSFCLEKGRCSRGSIIWYTQILAKQEVFCVHCQKLPSVFV